MTIAETKKAMIEYRDFFGGTLINSEDIKACKTKKELAEIIDAHDAFIESMATDAQSGLNRFKQKIGLSGL